MDPDWSLQADWARGCDIAADGVKYHCRSSRDGSRFLWKPGDHKDGIWLFGDTSGHPVITLAGWLYGPEAATAAAGGWITRDKLHSMEGLEYGCAAC